jgi:hypothetical protein
MEDREEKADYPRSYSSGWRYRENVREREMLGKATEELLVLTG